MAGVPGENVVKPLLLLLLVLCAVTAADPFAITVKTDHPGGSATNQFELPLGPGLGYDFTVAWGDGATQVITSDVSPTHTYASPGTYTVQITENVVGGFPAIRFNNTGDRLKLLEISQWGDVTWSTFQNAFFGCENLQITATDAATARTGNVWNFSAAWRECYELTSFPRINTSKGTDFSMTWVNCIGLTTFPSIDTSAGTEFFAAWFGCMGLTSFPRINTSRGTDFRSAWAACSSLTSFPRINTSAGQHFGGAWVNCSALTSFPLLDTSAGTNFFEAWGNCSGLTSFPLLDTSKGTDFSYAWNGCSGLTSFPALDLRNMTDGTDCLFGVTLPTTTYSNLLTALATTNNNPGVVFHGGGSRYFSTAAASRATLTGPRGWTITDGGMDLTSPMITSPLFATTMIDNWFTYQITANNSPTSFTASGLPAGLSINTSTGLISGRVARPRRTCEITITAINASGTGSAVLELRVLAPGGNTAGTFGGGSCGSGSGITAALLMALALFSLGMRRGSRWDGIVPNER